ncbi:MAG: MscS family membrane protein [Myxococcota bacterium]|jgi:MscS family membrane protein
MNLESLLEGDSISRAILAIPISIVLAMIVDVMGRWYLNQVAKKTASNFDDRAVELLRHPISLSIFLGGIGYTIARLDLPDATRFLLRATLLSVVVLYWSGVAMRGTTLILNYLTEHQDRWKVVQPRTLPIFNMVARILLALLSIYFLLLAWNINVTAWLASAGIVGIAVAYAAQDTLASLFAGVAILVDVPYQLDDYVIIEDGLEGQVTRIGFRSTRILTLDDVEIVVPNATMASSVITNMSGGPYPHARLSIPVGVAYGSDIDAVRDLLLEQALKLPHVVLDNNTIQPRVRFTTMGASSLDFVLQVWLDDAMFQADVLSRANFLIYKALIAAKVEIPYTKQDIYLYNMGKPEDSDSEDSD